MTKVGYVGMLRWLSNLKTDLSGNRGPDLISRSRSDLSVSIRSLDLDPFSRSRSEIASLESLVYKSDVGHTKLI